MNVYILQGKNENGSLILEILGQNIPLSSDYIPALLYSKARMLYLELNKKLQTSLKCFESG